MNEGIKHIIEKLKALELADLHGKKLDDTLANLKDRNEELEVLISKGNKKIESLNKLSIKALYHILRGNKKNELTIQQQRYLDISLEYTHNQKMIAQTEYEKEVIARKSDSQTSLKEQLRAEVLGLTETIDDANITQLKRILEKSQSNIGLIKEMEEAIDQGVIVNRKMNGTIKFLKTKAQKLFDEFKDKSIFSEVQTSGIEKYQDKIVSLKHALLKYEVEITDVYQLILKEKSYQSHDMSNLLDDYREHLIDDLFADKPLNKSYFFLKNLKEQILAVNRVLRSDLSKVRKEQKLLNEREHKLLSKLKKYDL